MRRVLRKVDTPHLDTSRFEEALSFGSLWNLFHSVIEKVFEVLRAIAHMDGPFTYDDLQEVTGFSRAFLRRVLKIARRLGFVISSSDVRRSKHPWLCEELFGEWRQKGPGRPKERFLPTFSLKKEFRDISIVSIWDGEEFK